jgi:hypothetical protein
MPALADLSSSRPGAARTRRTDSATPRAPTPNRIRRGWDGLERAAFGSTRASFHSPPRHARACPAHPGTGLAGLTATASTWAPGSSPGVTEKEGRSGLGDGCSDALATRDRLRREGDGLERATFAWNRLFPTPLVLRRREAASKDVPACSDAGVRWIILRLARCASGSG